MPLDVWDEAELRERMVASSGGPLRRRLAERWLRDKDLPELLRIVAEQKPKDVLAQQEKVAAADGLAFIAPIYWMNFPAILRGWVERVFTYRGASRVPQMCPECVRVFKEQTTTKCRLTGT